MKLQGKEAKAAAMIPMYAPYLYMCDMYVPEVQVMCTKYGRQGHCYAQLDMHEPLCKSVSLQSKLHQMCQCYLQAPQLNPYLLHPEPQFGRSPCQDVGDDGFGNLRLLLCIVHMGAAMPAITLGHLLYWALQVACWADAQHQLSEQVSSLQAP